MRSKRNQDWWSIVCGGPLANLVGGALADVAWVTPNRVTWLAFVCKLAVVPLILIQDARADLVAVILMQANVVLDCLDGTLARYRRTPSVVGAYLDKVTDAIGLVALMSAFGWRVYRDTGDTYGAILCVAAVMLWLTRIYAYWVIAYFEKEAGVPKPEAAGEQRRDLGELSFRERLAYYVRSTYRILFFAEADAFFWISLAVLTGWLRPVAWIYGLGLLFWSVGICIRWLVRAGQIDAWKRAQAGGR
ncbi:MAG: CDP-alcohol phosphatidyltransferase family protein [Kofleriaceae bacterium]